MRNVAKWAGAGLGVMLLGSALVLAADETAAPPKHAHAVRLTKPWSELTSLSDEQKTKILDIHGKVNDEIKAIHAKERQDIMAVLTDAQKKEVTELEAKGTTASKGKGGATTKPAGEEME